MISVKVELIGTLQRKLGKRKLNVTLNESATVMDLIQKLGIDSSSKSNPFVGRKAADPRSKLLIMVNCKEVGLLNGLNTVLEEGAAVAFIPFSHGG